MPSYGAEISWSGFGSIVGGKTVSEETLPSGSSSTFQVDPSLTGRQNATYTDVLSFNPDTSFGLQANIDLGNGLTATSQLTSRGGNDFDMQMEWLYVSYEINSQLLLKAGKQRLPLYYFSDYLDVGYSYHWLRPPIHVYGEGYTTYQGASLTYNGYLGDWDYNLHTYLGDSQATTAPLGDGALENLVGAIVSIENGWLTFRLSSTITDFWVNYQDTVPEAARLTSRNEPYGLTFSSAAVFIDPGTYFIGAEATLLSANDDILQSGLTGATFDQRDSWMVTAGMRFGKLTPHITFSERITFLTGHANPVFNDLESGSKAVIIGARYNFHPTATLKLDYTSTEDISSGLLQQAGGKSQEVDAISAGIDFLF
ncbi:MAG: hypothetical protein KUG76_07075 [Gammaproteobacteria bacterium]|nr:hypothetical protein [Gammaproteobacteria bacterium]